MQIKKYEAKTMTEALRKIKQELGPEAVILSARSLNSMRGIMGNLKKRGVEVTAAIDASGGKLKEKPEKIISEYRKNYGQDERSGKKNIIQTIRGGIQFSGKKRTPVQNREKADRTTNTIIQRYQSRMISLGIKQEIIIELIGHIKRYLSSSDHPKDQERKAKNVLAQLFEQMGILTGGIQTKPGESRIIAFVGPTGVGKTTTIAKLATHYALNMKKKVGLISLDNYRIAANSRLEVLAGIIDIPIKVASTGQQLMRFLRENKKQDLVFIDTPGISPREEYKINELRLMLEKTASAEIHLLLSNATDEKDMRDIIDRFKALSYNRLIFTKIDESPNFGKIINRLFTNNIPVSYYTEGQQIPEDIEAMTPEKLSAMIIGDKNMKSDIAQFELEKSKEKVVKPRNKNNEIVITPAGRYVANKNSDIFHHHGCKWTAMIKKENMLVFDTEVDAQKASFKPCRSCCSEILAKRYADDDITEAGRNKIASYGSA